MTQRIQINLEGLVPDNDERIVPKPGKPPRRCNFCGKLQSEVARMIEARPNGHPGVVDRATICDECISLCVELLAGDR